MDFGFTLAGGKSSPVLSNEPSLYVVSVNRGGLADGKLKINDCLIKVGNLSCSSVDCDTIWNFIRSTKNRPLTLTLKRRRSSSQANTVFEILFGIVNRDFSSLTKINSATTKFVQLQSSFGTIFTLHAKNR